MSRYMFTGCAVAALFIATTSFADVYSIDGESPGAVIFHPADALAAGPQVHVPAAVIGAVTGDDLNALSSGLDSVDGSDVIYFSVDRQSLGDANAIVVTGNGSFDSTYNVPGQAANGQQAGDIFATIDPNLVESQPVGHNILMKNQTSYGLVPAGFSGLEFMSHTGPQDNLDGYSQEEFDIFGNDGVPDRPMFFSGAATSPSIGPSGSAADILVYDPQDGDVEEFATYTMLGLQQADDIDALALNLAIDYSNGDVLGGAMYFSLAPGSPTLGSTLSPADIFMLTFAYDDGNDILNPTSGPFVRYPHFTLGLLFEDNVDALETNAYVPEPATLALIGLSGLVALRRRKA